MDWPPTPQRILKDEDPFDADTYNFLAWIVDPNAPIGKNDMDLDLLNFLLKLEHWVDLERLKRV